MTKKSYEKPNMGALSGSELDGISGGCPQYQVPTCKEGLAASSECASGSGANPKCMGGSMAVSACSRGDRQEPNA